ncbi:MAG: FIG00816212: Putative membrane protein [uncultured Acidimicrobiales bacterium]|uniref:FIG00816212: Putative membrane protein n=1 Tax=uncultured Acidimicrobiales bacterium TaxID=310071 RepID=A0A6J4HRF8_9ACTN|nr:MAG: FIG00816212: Putative membrane protein [uncultured Acidimicrobiales bacterium]
MPRGGIRFGVHYDTEAFGRFSESIARLLGTGKFLVFQTAAVTLWIVVNVFAARLRWDPYPFILLNLAFSTQAAYAAPLILLAQNRQAERDRFQTERDRETNARSLAETEFLGRELASIRIALSDVVTNADLDKRFERLLDDLELRMATPLPAEDEAPDAGTAPLS